MAFTEPVPPQRFGLPASALDSLADVFGQFPEIDKVVLYGSRAMDRYRSGSDIDLAVSAPDMGWATFLRLEQAIDDLLLPWKVDLALIHQIENQELMDHIQRVGVLLYKA
ncbi:Predicted nucleotidyltransferase [Marinobacter daqiaonensis]|uniref:Predicted nucleotidyltransferase n=1 Tax=Marinobacter daqiaonensis TaxID=650891 RepID=A0A1I6HAR6_9GAMM|nr:nucleotidyltransferase domain-containing protein [Marinobacter daqiaonensis]SFR51470.1 Predicted nucleotidyltransferase [Marinobacter daqiaonensis]